MTASVLLWVAVVALSVSTVCALSVPPTVGSLATNFSVSKIEARSLSFTCSLTNGAGTFQLDDRRFDAIAYESQMWTAYDELLIDLIGISTDSADLAIVYLYASPSTLKVSFAYTESFDSNLREIMTTGSLSDYQQGPSTVAVNLPGLDRMPSALDTEIQVSGADINWDGHSTGWVVLNSSSFVAGSGGSDTAAFDIDAASGGPLLNFTWVPFRTVDCSQCESFNVSVVGWYELHSLLVLDDTRACFAIFYLYLQQPAGPVIMNYGLCFGGAPASMHARFDASWTGKLGGVAPAASGPRHRLQGP